ncbi:MAG: flagellar hook-associated protein FlgL [Candidatus Delongbacteria bacterium]|nr:flagellar hook-associated protein FlgL [Candidatus Delongbacteria bacterium]MBN2835700.1 flagellar hook-associated protein FlgL [Candidatus Delongbacteria bacterium]
MRITSNMMQANIKNRLTEQMNKLYKLNDDLSSGERIHKVSDDPFNAGLAIRYDQQIGQTTQWIENADSGREWIAHTTQVLGQVKELTQSVYSKAIQGDNDTITQSEKDTLARLIDQELEEVLKLTNNSYNGKHIFNGDVINAAPFMAVRDEKGMMTSVAVFAGFEDGNPQRPTYVHFQEEEDGSMTGLYLDKNGDLINSISNDSNHNNINIDGSMSRRISSSEIVNIAVNGTDAFMPNGPDGTGDLFTSIIKVRDGLFSGDRDSSGSQIDDLVDAMQNVTAWQSKSGTIYTRLDITKEILETDKIELNDALSRIKDTDIADAMMEYTKNEAVYSMALNVGARIMMTTLADYM